MEFSSKQGLNQELDRKSTGLKPYFAFSIGVAGIKVAFLAQILAFGRARNNFKKSNSSGTLLRCTCEYVSVRLNSYFTCLNREMLFGF